jgi:microsomal epoxide hydrolase
MGSILSSWMAFDYPENVTALHLSNVLFLVLPDEDQQTPEEKEWNLLNGERRRGEDGYRTQQGTRPTTLAYGLTDSPVGLAAWIMEKFHGWTLPGTTEDPPFDLDELLANVMLYWIAGPNPASWYYISIYEERGFIRRRFPDGRRVEVPTGAMIGANDTVVAPPQSVIARSYNNLVRRTDLPSGGHFPSLEHPERFLDDVRTFFRAYR